MIGRNLQAFSLILTFTFSSLTSAQTLSEDLVACANFLSRHSDTKVLWGASELIPADGNLPNQKFQHLILKRSVNDHSYPVVVRATNASDKNGALGVVAHQLATRVGSANHTYSVKDQGYHSTCSRSSSSTTSACANIPLTFSMSQNSMNFLLNPKEARLAQGEKLTPLKEDDQFGLIANTLIQQINHFNERANKKPLTRDERLAFANALNSCEGATDQMSAFAEQKDSVLLLSQASFLKERVNSLRVHNTQIMKTDSIGKKNSKKGRVKPTRR